MIESIAPFQALAEADAEANSDARLLREVQRGDADAYELIMRKYNQRLYRVARGILRNDADAEDVVQEAWIKALGRLDQFRYDGSFGAWLSRITANEAYMRIRRTRLEVTDADVIDRHLSTQAAPEKKAPDHALANEQLRLALRDAIEGLPTGFRMVFVLRSLEGLSVQETARSLGLREATVKTRFHRARRMLRDEFEAQMKSAGTELYEFAGERCDRMVHSVLQRLSIRPGAEPQGEVH
ncbi:RNA polymerase sigma factor [Ectothiorhodospiraceae bacterium WFHF3C12]|nr:RNA polymerase sigma factor [Ectothiorhodospiraceae bacterium WFHF3C12]